MALFISKPILWNREGYQRPSGVRANSGYPKIHGFGHEEWNNSPALGFEEDGVQWRVLHTEGVGHAPVDEEAGRVFLFLYASHDGVQELVGVAGNATCLMERPDERQRIVSRLKIDRLGEQAWAVPRVKECHGNRRDRFDETWETDLHWIPNWRCPAESFLWLDRPARLDPQALRGTAKLLTMFGRHTDLDEVEALQMLEAVPAGQRAPAWHRIRSDIVSIEESDASTDVMQLSNRGDLKKTTKKQLIDARLGQGRFRRDLEQIWGNACAVSGCGVSAVLRASHILAWRDSNDLEKLDGANGLLLRADLDALFDRGLISFADDGAMLLADQLTRTDRRLLGVPQALRQRLSANQHSYLRRHRQRWGF
jgi:hypothetical protein